jgi:exonuclease III
MKMNADSETGVHIRMLCLCVLAIFTISHSPNVNGQEHDIKGTLLLSISFDEVAASSYTDAHAEGIKGNGLDLKNCNDIPKLPDIGLDQFSGSEDFSVSVWVKSSGNASEPGVILSNADFSKKPMGIYGRRKISNGFTLYSQNGSWGWNIGNGRLHYNYEPIAADQAVNDNKWHNLVFSYNAVKKEARLFYDGINRAIFSVGDLEGQDFLSDLPLRLGGDNDVSAGDRTFSGVIDELQIWGCAITPEAVKELYSEYCTVAVEPELTTDEFTVVNWNIWHGGTHFTKEKDGFDGIERTVGLIQRAGADIVLMQETYGAGSKISSSLGYYYYEACSTIGAVWGANLSVMSRYPMEDAFMVEKRTNYGKNAAFNNGGVIVRLAKGKKVAAFSNWYNRAKPQDLDLVLKAWSSINENADTVPVIYGGDYNSASHLDDGIGKSGHSKLMADAGFIDSFRQLHPDVKKYPGGSIGSSGKDRIDYIYYKGTKLNAIKTDPIVSHFKGSGRRTPGYPSDHLGGVTRFIFESKSGLVSSY